MEIFQIISIGLLIIVFGLIFAVLYLVSRSEKKDDVHHKHTQELKEEAFRLVADYEKGVILSAPERAKRDE